jgi:DNA-binding transcriptional regulator YdaS (Cro superfamily)
MKAHFRRTILQLGNTLYGPRWQAKFAQMTGLSPAYVSMISSGARPTTPQIESAVRQGLENEIVQLQERQKLIRNLLDKYKFASEE